jgi:hypothetical protein
MYRLRRWSDSSFGEIGERFAGPEGAALYGMRRIALGLGRRGELRERVRRIRERLV